MTLYLRALGRALFIVLGLCAVVYGVTHPAFGKDLIYPGLVLAGMWCVATGVMELILLGRHNGP